MDHVILDVRELDEFNAEHIEGAIHVPLSRFNSCAPAILRQLAGKKILMMCKSGGRAQIALDEMTKLGLNKLCEATVYEGGMQAWKEKGNATNCVKSGHLPIMRQVQLIAGLLVITSVLLTLFVNFKFIALAAFVGTGLTVAGSTGFCLMAKILARMPWNKCNS